LYCRLVESHLLEVGHIDFWGIVVRRSDGGLRIHRGPDGKPEKRAYRCHPPQIIPDEDLPQIESRLAIGLGVGKVAGLEWRVS
jgi:hypothetical protein